MWLKAVVLIFISGLIWGNIAQAYPHSKGQDQGPCSPPPSGTPPSGPPPNGMPPKNAPCGPSPNVAQPTGIPVETTPASSG